MNLIKTAFWLSIVILLLPTGREGDVDNNADKVSLNQAVSAANETATDLAGFCGRNPVVCETGQSAVKTFADKAKYGANMLYEWAADSKTAPSAKTAPSEGLGKQADAHSAISSKMDKINKADRLKSSAKNKANRAYRSQNTLSRDDLEPAWKGPKENA